MSERSTKSGSDRPKRHIRRRARQRAAAAGKEERAKAKASRINRAVNSERKNHKRKKRKTIAVCQERRKEGQRPARSGERSRSSTIESKLPTASFAATKPNCAVNESCSGHPRRLPAWSAQTAIHSSEVLPSDHGSSGDSVRRRNHCVLHIHIRGCRGRRWLRDNCRLVHRQHRGHSRRIFGSRGGSGGNQRAEQRLAALRGAARRGSVGRQRLVRPGGRRCTVAPTASSRGVASGSATARQKQAASLHRHAPRSNHRRMRRTRHPADRRLMLRLRRRWGRRG